MTSEPVYQHQDSGLNEVIVGIITVLVMLTAAVLFFYFRDISNYLLGKGVKIHKFSNMRILSFSQKETPEMRKMAETDVKKCLSWMVEQQEMLESEKFGQHQAAVTDGVKKQKNTSKEIDNRKKDIDRLVQKYKIDQSEAKKLSTTFSSLKAVSDKRTSCYDVISQIASLEDAVEEMSIGFDSRAVHLCNIADSNNKDGNKTQSNESLAKTAQKCISGVRTNWAWIRKLVHCSDCHLKNAANYHEFFHEIDEAEYFMNSTLAKIHLTFNPKSLQGDARDAKQILNEMKDVLLAYLTWQSKVDNLFDRAKEIVPVPERLKKLETPRPAVALVDYKTDKVTFLEHETVTLLDTSDKKNWVIKTETGQSGTVPAITLLIPGPSGDALDSAIRMRVELLSLWTASIKRLGFQMIAFMLMVIRDWNEEEVKCLQSLPEEDREELLRILKFIEETLMPNWKEYPDFQELQERILRTKMILEEAPESEGLEKDPKAAAVIVQVKLLEEMLTRYKDFSDYWETYKVMVESMREPKFLLVADPKDTMKFVSTAHMARYWDTSVDVKSLEGAEGIIEPIQAETVSVTESARKDLESVTSGVTISTEREEFESDEVVSSVQEVRTTFVIKTVLDPRDNTELSLQEAIMIGVIDQTTGMYKNPDTGETFTITEAMNEGKIGVEFTSKKKIKDEKQSFGLITIKTKKKKVPTATLR